MVRPRLSPSTTGPATQYGEPSKLAAASTRPASTSSRILDEEQTRSPSFTGGTTSTTDGAARLELAHEDARGEVVGRQRRQRRVERQHAQEVDAARGDARGLLVVVQDQRRRERRVQHLGRVRREREHAGERAALAGDLD